MPRQRPLEHRVAERILALRRKNKMTQEALADKSGHSRNTISNIETGEVLADLNTLENIADAFGISLATLFRGIERRT